MSTSGENTRTRQNSNPVIGPRCQRAVISCPAAAITPMPTANVTQNVTAISSRWSRNRIVKTPDDDDPEREHHPRRHRPPPEGERIGPRRPEEDEAEDEPEVRGVEEVVAAEADQVLREERHGCRPGEDPPAVHAPPVPVLRAGNAEDERDAVPRQKRARRPHDHPPLPERDPELEDRARQERDEDLGDRELEAERRLPEHLQRRDDGCEPESRVSHLRQQHGVRRAANRERSPRRRVSQDRCTHAGHRTVEEPIPGRSPATSTESAEPVRRVRAVALFFEACSTFAPALDTASRGDIVRVNPRISVPATIHPFAGMSAVRAAQGAETGLYAADYEHDACGVAFVARLDAKPLHETVRRALEALENLEHRGAAGADPGTGDGAGILIQIPDAFFRAVVGDCASRRRCATASRCASFPAMRRGARSSRARLAAIVDDEGQKVVCWRDVPVDPAFVGRTAGAVRSRSSVSSSWRPGRGCRRPGRVRAQALRDPPPLRARGRRRRDRRRASRRARSSTRGCSPRRSFAATSRTCRTSAPSPRSRSSTRASRPTRSRAGSSRTRTG